MNLQAEDAPSAFLHLRRASRAVCHLYDLALAPTGLKASQFMVLHAIGASAGIAHCELARDFGASVETLSRRLAGARKSGWVRVESGEHQRRIYHLTAAGKEAVEQARPYWENAQARLRRAMLAEDWKALGPFMDRLTAAAARAERLPLSHRSPNLAALEQHASPVPQALL